MQQANKVHVIGIGYRPLDSCALKALATADVIFSSRRLAEVFDRYGQSSAVKDKVVVIQNVEETFRAVRTARSEAKKVVLLASGDPLFYGIGRRMVTELGRENVEIISDLSSIQVAFSRIKEPWDDAVLMSLHGGADPVNRKKLKCELQDIPAFVAEHAKVAILTDRLNNPAEIAKILALSFRGRDDQSPLVLYVCEHLGYSDEKITRGTPDELAAKSFPDPNIVIILNVACRNGRPQSRFGLKEDDIVHERGLITKDEVRAVTLHKLCLPVQGVFWDIGAGSGSVSLEAARLCPGLRVFAVEKDPERIEAVRTNVLRYMVRNIEIVRGSAPDAVQDLPAPDRVFIGGSGGSLNEIVKLVHQKMASGIIIINAASLDTLNAALSSLEQNEFRTDVSEISVSRSKNIAARRLLSALNPVFVIKGEKG